MGLSPGDRPPYWAVRELLNWAADRWAELEADWIKAGNTTDLIDLPLRKLVVLSYADVVSGRDPEARRRVDNILSRPPGLAIDDMPDVPIPADWDLDDIPPDMRPEF